MRAVAAVALLCSVGAAQADPRRALSQAVESTEAVQSGIATLANIGAVNNYAAWPADSWPDLQGSFDGPQTLAENITPQVQQAEASLTPAQQAALAALAKQQQAQDIQQLTQQRAQMQANIKQQKNQRLSQASQQKTNCVQQCQNQVQDQRGQCEANCANAEQQSVLQADAAAVNDYAQIGIVLNKEEAQMNAGLTTEW